MAYTQVYSTTDMKEAVTDIMAGLFAGVATMAETYGVAIIALAVVGSLFAILAILKSRR